MILSMHCTWNIQEMILVISMQQCYIDVYKSHLENDTIYAMYKKYSGGNLHVLSLYGRQSCSQQMKIFWKLCLRMMTLMKETC